MAAQTPGSAAVHLARALRPDVNLRRIGSVPPRPRKAFVRRHPASACSPARQLSRSRWVERCALEDNVARAGAGIPLRGTRRPGRMRWLGAAAPVLGHRRAVAARDSGVCPRTGPRAGNAVASRARSRTAVPATRLSCSRSSTFTFTVGRALRARQESRCARQAPAFHGGTDAGSYGRPPRVRSTTSPYPVAVVDCGRLRESRSDFRNVHRCPARLIGRSEWLRARIYPCASF